MKALYCFVLLLLLVSCSKKCPLRDLKVINSKYYYKDELFTGYVIRKFDSGQTAAESHFENGVPNGRDVSYDYQGDIVTEGITKPYYLKNNTISDINDVRRLSIDEWKEGNETLVSISIISNTTKPEMKFAQTPFCKALIDTLVSNHIKVNASLIYRIYFLKAEFDESK